MDIQKYFELGSKWLLTSGLRVLLIVILTLVALKVARFISIRIFPASKKEKDPEFQKRADTLSSAIRYILVIAILIVAAMTVMGELGIEIGPVLAAAGIVGLAVGFGAQRQSRSASGRWAGSSIED